MRHHERHVLAVQAVQLLVRAVRRHYPGNQFAVERARPTLMLCWLTAFSLPVCERQLLSVQAAVEPFDNLSAGSPLQSSHGFSASSAA